MNAKLGFLALLLSGCSSTMEFSNPHSYKGIVHKKDDSGTHDNYGRIDRYAMIIDTYITPYNKCRNDYRNRHLHSLIEEEDHEVEVGGREITENKFFLGLRYETVYRIHIDTAGFDIDKGKYPPARNYASFERPDTIGIDGITVPKRDTLWFDGKRTYKPSRSQNYSSKKTTNL